LANKEGVDCDLCLIYLRSTAQKHLFAEKRLKSLNRKIAGYRQKCEVNQYGGITWPVTLYIEMDFDHCVLSLRSSLEHLAQLINAIVPLNLAPKRTKGKTHVTLDKVIEEINGNDQLRSNEYLSSLSSFLKSEMEENWYKDFQELRNTMAHVKFDRFPRTTLKTPERQLLNLKFLLPSGTAKSLVTEEERDITSYCKDVIKKVESVLKESFDLLSKCHSK